MGRRVNFLNIVISNSYNDSKGGKGGAALEAPIDSKYSTGGKDICYHPEIAMTLS
jgi:hypothetical protein